MNKNKVVLLSIIYFVTGCASLPSVTAPTLGKLTFLEMTNQDNVYVMLSLTENSEVIFEKLIDEQPKNLMAIYDHNRTTYESSSEKIKQYRDCIVLKKNKIHKPCSQQPVRGSVLVKNRLTGAGLVAGAIMSPFIFFEATLQTLTGDTQGAKKKMGEFEGTTEPKYDQETINNIGNTILKELTVGYELALSNGSESGYLIQITRTHDEVLYRAQRITLLNAQKFLLHQNLYLGKADGIHGEQTKIALSRFQRNERLEVTGALDEHTRIAMVDQFQATEFEYILASQQNTIESYHQFLANNPRSKNIALATNKKNDLVEIRDRKLAKVSEQKRLAMKEKKRKEQAVQRRAILNEISDVNWERGDLAYLCRKKFWNLFSDWETCDARVLEVTSNKANIEFEWSCGIGWEKGATKWVDLSQLMPRDNCDSYMHLIQ